MRKIGEIGDIWEIRRENLGKEIIFYTMTKHDAVGLIVTSPVTNPTSENSS